MSFRLNYTNNDNLNSFKNDNDLNMPIYNDETINKEINERESKERLERENREKEEAIKLKKEDRKNLIPIMNISEYLLIACAFLIILATLSLFTFNFMYAIYSIVSIVITLYIGRRLKINFDEELNIILWNTSESFKDFFEYRLKYDFLSGSRERLNKISIIFSVILFTFNSNSIVFSVSLVLMIFCYVVSFSNKEIDSIEYNSKIIILGALAGLIIKTLLNTFFSGVLVIDFMNIIVLNIFVAINTFSREAKIHEPV